MPDVSIIIPTLNRARLLAGTLEGVAKVLDHSQSTEVIVVDNGSSDQTTAVFNEIKTKFRYLDWRYVYEPMPGLLSGRHRGAKEARGEILSYLDDDVLLTPSWLEGLREGFADGDTALVSGPSLPEFEVTPPEWLDGLWQGSDDNRTLCELSLIDLGSKVRTGSPLFAFGLNFSIRRDVFLACGGFHPDIVPAALQRYQGDGETGLTLKIEAANLRALYHPKVAVRHVISAGRLTPASFERRGFFQGVCDSYTCIRREGVGPKPFEAGPRRFETWKAGFRYLRSKLFEHRRPRQREAQAIVNLISRANSAGFAFHQNEVCSDPSLFRWVMKSDYFDYALPEERKSIR